MNKKFSITLIAAILLLNGCGSVRENRIRQDVLSDTSMPEEIRRAIDLKQLVAGMTQEQVIASWGLPCKWCFGTRKSASGDTWEYHLPGSDSVIVGADFLGIGTGTYLYFDSSKTLKHWSQK
jgi:outer membrane protein assembly factor BamE